MARASRSKTPEFDPSELEDLIMTPAVGSGVGSHLLSHEAEVKPPTVVILEQTTIGDSNITTVDIPNPSGQQEPLYNKDTESTTVVRSIPTSVVQLELSTVAELTTVGEPTTVVRSAPQSFWLTEAGEFVPASRIKRIRLAQDVLSPAEEAVYDTLWGVRGGPREERENYRIAQAGYDYLMKRTRLSKKTIQRIVDRLIDKGFIAIDKPADIYQRTSTIYRVYTYRAVLDRQAERGRFHVAKIGPGFVYVREMATPTNLTTVVESGMTTGPLATTTTGAKDNQTTVAVETTKRIEQSFLDQSSSSPAEVQELKVCLEQHLGPLDDDATRQLLALCRRRAPDCTVEEIAYFVGYKMRSVNGIHNPVGFILTAVPRHFENNAHSSVRALLREESARRRRNWEEEYRYWQTTASDLRLSPEERRQAEEVIRSLENSPDRPPEIR